MHKELCVNLWLSFSRFMIAKSILNRFLPFILGLACGIAATLPFGEHFVGDCTARADRSSTRQPAGTGSSGASVRPDGYHELAREERARPGTNKVNILSKPQALYTDEARANETAGSVKLKVTLLASGQVGAITVVDRLPDGLTEKALEAARKIKFEPATVNGTPVSKVVTIQYTFTIY